jgi:hypothetical protein
MPDERQARDLLRADLHDHETALRKQSQAEGADRRPKKPEELDRIATDTARRYDSGRGARQR